MKIIESDSLGKAWLLAMENIMKYGENILDEDVRLREVRNLYISINSIHDFDPILDQYADRDRVELMKKKYATCGLVGDYKIDYGSYIYDNNGINQIDWVINRIRNKPETKSATITLHKPGEEMLACLSMLDFKYRNSILDMTAVYRSQNVFWSQPGNMLALHKIHNDVATELDYKFGKVELIVISAHIYEDDFEKVNGILDKAREQSLL